MIFHPRDRKSLLARLALAPQRPLQLVYNPLEGYIVYFMDRKQGLWLAWGIIQKAAQKAPQEGFPMYFFLCFMVLLRQLRRLYISGSIFQVLLVYNYSTCCTNCVLTRFDTPSIYLRVQVAYATNTLLKHQLRGEVRQYIDHIVYLNIIDSHYRLKEYTILYVFHAPRHDLLPLIQYQQLLIY